MARDVWHIVSEGIMVRYLVIVFVGFPAYSQIRPRHHYSHYFTYYMNDKLQNGCVLYLHMYCVVFFDRGLCLLLDFITILILTIKNVSSHKPQTFNVSSKPIDITNYPYSRWGQWGNILVLSKFGCYLLLLFDGKNPKVFRRAR